MQEKVQDNINSLATKASNESTDVFPRTDPSLATKASNESTGAIAVTVGTAVAVGVVGVAVAVGIAVLIATRHARKGSG